MRRTLPATLLILAFAAGAFLRFDDLARPSLWLDEILGYDLATYSLAHKWTSWLFGFESEHGPLFYATQLMARVSESPEFSARMAPAFFGVLTLLLVWLAATAIDKTELLTFGAMAFLATSPLHVYYSREARPYALLILLTAALLGALLTRMPVWSIGLLLLAAVYTSATCLPILVAVAAAGLVGGLLGHNQDMRRRDLMASLLAAVACGVVPFLYGGEAKSTPDVGQVALSLEFFRQLLRSFSVTALAGVSGTTTAVAVLVLAIGGAVDLVRRNVRQGVIVLLMTLLPIAVAVFALVQFRHFYSVRYVAAGLIGYALLVGAGIAMVARWTRQAQWVVAAVLTALIAWQTVPAARKEPLQKLDWRLIASTIWSHAHDGDRVFTAEPWSTVSLRFYLERLPQRVRLAEVFPVLVAEIIAGNERPIWIVTAGYSADTSIRDWACRFPVLLASPLESFRIHYSPATDHFLESRSTPIEQRAWTAGGSKTGLVRLAEYEPSGLATYLDQGTAWLMNKSRLPPGSWNRDAVARVVSRLGYDPETALPRLTTGAVDLEDLVEWIAPANGCLDDLAFVQRSLELLLQRPSTPAQEQYLLALLRAGKSRTEIIRTIVATDEFRRTLQR
jgi:hypothetical protein